MKIRTFYRLEHGIYRVSINTEEWSENDIKLMEKFGEPELNIGGDITYQPEDQSIEPVTWHLDDEYRRIKSEPISASFDSRDMPFAEKIANKWADQVIVAIAAAFRDLHQHVDEFTRETVSTLSIY